jgi:hypothetical protein
MLAHRFLRIACIVALAVTALSTPPTTDGVQVTVQVDAAIADEEVGSEMWADTLGHASKGRIGAPPVRPVAEALRPVHSIVQRNVAPAVDVSNAFANHRRFAMQAAQRRGLRFSLTVRHYADVPIIAETDTEADALRTKIGELPPLARANSRLLALAIDVDADGGPQVSSILGDGGAALLNGTVTMCAGDPMWAPGDCPAPGVHLTACAAHRDSELQPWATKADREYDAGFRVGAFGRAVSDLTSAWPLEYAWTSPELRSVARRCAVRDATCSATPLYRRMPTVAFSTPTIAKSRHEAAAALHAPHCFISQALSPFHLCSNSLLGAVSAALSDPTVSDDVDVERDVATIAGERGTTQRPKAAIADTVVALFSNPLRRVLRGAHSAATVGGMEALAERPGLTSGGTASQRMKHVHKRTWAPEAVSQRAAFIDACEAVSARAEHLTLHVATQRSFVKWDTAAHSAMTESGSEGFPAILRLETTVRLEAVFIGDDDANALMTELAGQIGALSKLPKDVAKDESYSVEVNVGPMCKCRPHDPTADCCNTTFVEPVVEELSDNIFGGDVAAADSAQPHVRGQRRLLVDALVEARGEHRGRLRTRLSLPLTPIDPQLLREAAASDPHRTAPVAGALDVNMRWPALLFQPNLATARLALVRGSGVNVSSVDRATFTDGNWSSFTHPCFSSPVLAAARFHEPSGVWDTHVHIPIVSTAECHVWVRRYQQQQGRTGDQPAAVQIDLLVDFAFSHLHADEYAPDMNRYYSVPTVLARLTGAVHPRGGNRHLYGMLEAIRNTPPGDDGKRVPMRGFIGPWFDANVAHVLAVKSLPERHLLATRATTAYVFRRIRVEQWAMSTHKGLAVSPPIPDRAMPFNALAFWGTMLALVVMSTFNQAIRGVAASRGRLSEAEARALVEEIVQADALQ